MSVLPRHEIELHERHHRAAFLAATPDEPASESLTTRPLWVITGQVGVILAVFLGFGVMASLELIPPKLTALLLFCCVAGMIALGPARLINKVIISAPLVAVVGWWMASFLWSNDASGWWRDTQAMLPLVLGFAVIAGLLPGWAFRGALVAACYLAVAFTVLQLGINPGEAMTNSDDVAGWRGGFIHKNAMAPFMLFAGLTIACFDRRPLRRGLGLTAVAVLVIMSQSGTSIATGLAVLLVCMFLARIATSDQATGAVLAVSAAATAVVAGVAIALFLPNLLEFGGKDPTLTSRTEIWSGAWVAVGQQPWLGYGAGSVWTNLNIDPARSILRDLGFTVFHSHNGFLELLLLLGVIGLVLWTWLVVSTLRLGLAHLREQPGTGVFVAGFVLLMLLTSITEVTTLGIWLAMLGALNCHLLRTIDRTSLRTPALGVLMGGVLVVTLGAASIAALSARSTNGPIDSITIVPGNISPDDDDDDGDRQDIVVHLPRPAEIPSTTIGRRAEVGTGAVVGTDATAERLDDVDGVDGEPSPPSAAPREPDDRSTGSRRGTPDSVPPPAAPVAPPPPPAQPIRPGGSTPPTSAVPPSRPAPAPPSTKPAPVTPPTPPPTRPAPAPPPPTRPAPAPPRPTPTTTTPVPTTIVVDDDEAPAPPADSGRPDHAGRPGRPDNPGKPDKPRGPDTSGQTDTTIAQAPADA
jgi:exopolysaccharide production protein ExoQ